MNLPILYSLTSKGQTQLWRIEVSGDRFRTVEGIKDGVMTESAWTVCFGKNEGKANATSACEQAEKEARAKHKKKLEAGYWLNESDIHKSKFFEPMLAHKWVDYPETSFPLYASAKYDGQRILITKDGMFTRNGKPILSVPHIWEDVKNIVEGGQVVLDGELYNHDLKHDFNKLISLAKKQKPTAEDLKESREVVQFYIFDCYFVKEKNTPFDERKTWIETLFAINDFKYCRLVKNSMVDNKEQAMAKFAEYIEDGYEGMMLRVPDSPYENKRSRYLLKYKEFMDEEFEVVDIEEGKGGRAGMMGRFILKNKDGSTFEANARGNQDYYRQLLAEKQEIIGKLATVRYQNLTPDGVPRFGVVVGVRCDI